jgi:hypothetical protein
MTQQARTGEISIPIDAGRQIAQLRRLLRLVDELAGRASIHQAADEALLDEAARVTAAYGNAMPIVQRRFDALAGETTAWSAAAVEALLACGQTPTAAPARRVADELQRALSGMTKLLRL